MARLGNKYLNEKEAWRLLKEGKEKEAKDVMYTCLFILREIAIHLAPFAPLAAEELWKMIGEEGSVHERGRLLESGREPPREVGEPKPLFQKLPKDFLERIDELLEEARKKVEKVRPI